ncbi:MAG: N-acetylhexosamine 1-kinase [Firmicutes bacterium ADurb.Bin300]|nr:MAG: N-acetylhexosamine 1-kinase [Firmicutes bacterium ADurb.Bin300]HOD02759.1 phosphotransferase [Clostridiales bacterium]
MKEEIKSIIVNFPFEGEFIDYYPVNNGHINDTFVIEFENKFGEINSFLLQKINVSVFKNPDELMKNILGVTDFLKKKIIKSGGDPDRECLTVIKTKDGQPFFYDERFGHWRCYNYISDSYSIDFISSPEVFMNAAKAFGKFQKMLSDYPIDTLYDTIPNFHNTSSRYADFINAVEQNLSGRLDTCLPEVEFAKARKADADVLVNLLNKGKLPLRVTHNDTKLNNVMFDKASGESICIVDLDTVMPGLSLYDFGDSIRFGANTAAEDERDLSKVSLDLELFELYVRGYLSQAGDSLTEREINYLPFSAKLMTYECGMRFLTDYINGDKYFRVHFPDHNLVRCRTQFALVADIEQKLEKMKRIIENAKSKKK